MLNQFSRTELLLGKEAMNKLENSRVEPPHTLTGIETYIRIYISIKDNYV